MSMTKPETTVDRAIESFAAQKNVSNPSAQGENSNVAGGTLVTIKYLRDNRDAWGWYYEKGDVQKVLFRAEDLASFIGNQIRPKTIFDTIQSTPIQELAKITVVSVLTFIFALTVVFVVVKDPENKSLQVLTGLLGLTIGYFVGRGDKPA